MATLPITRVVLYKHGVGYFEREGAVEGEATLTCTFRQAEVSDVLKSLTVLDLSGGLVAAVSYDSTKPVEQRLADLALSIPDENSLLGLLPQLKGARVAVRLGSDVPPAEGTLVGVDVSETHTEAGPDREVLLSLLTASGELLAFDLYAANVRLLDDGLRRDLEYYLLTQLSEKKKEARTFTFFARGEGRRTVRLSYVLEAPVWKATYRMLLGEEGQPPMIQGWAVVDNAQDEDWSNVELALVAGLPVSFVHDLYTPRYVCRPTVAVQETTGVLPPMVEEGIGDGSSIITEFADNAIDFTAMKATSAGVAKMAHAVSRAKRLDVQTAASTTPAQVRERQVGDLFEYAIDHPVSIGRNQSALVPIVLKPFRGRSVLLYQKQARPQNPLRCIEFENSTGLTLEGGPVTVLEAGTYVGEAMLETTRPGEQRLVAYAVELGVRVLDNLDSRDDRVTRVVVDNSLLTLHVAQVTVTTYSLHNKTPREQTVYLEHPRRTAQGRLTDTPAPHEVTENAWRFQFVLPPEKTTHFPVKVEEVHEKHYALRDATGTPQLEFWLQQRYLDAATAEALRQLMALRQQAAAAEEKVKLLGQERDGIHKEQKRIRENLQALGDRPAEKDLRERFVRTLNAQEDRLELIDREERAAIAERDACREQIDDVLAKLAYEAAV